MRVGARLIIRTFRNFNVFMNQTGLHYTSRIYVYPCVQFANYNFFAFYRFGDCLTG